MENEIVEQVTENQSETSYHSHVALSATSMNSTHIPSNITINRYADNNNVENSSCSNQWEEMMNKEILKYAIKRGHGTESASLGTVVRCNLKGYIKSQHEGDSIPQLFDPTLHPFEILTDQCFQIGESDTIPALELTLRHAHVGEVFRVRCSSKYAYGPTARPVLNTAQSLPPSAIKVGGTIDTITNTTSMDIIASIPPNTPLEYEVEVLEHIDLTEPSATATDSVATLQRDMALRDVTLRKDCGNRWFSYNEYIKAGRSYSKGAEKAESYLKSCSEEVDSSTEENADRVSMTDPDNLLLNIYIACLNNLTACYISQKEYLKAKEVATHVIEISPNNIKALLRAAKASLALHLYEECELCLETVLSIEPDNEAAMKEKNKLKAALKVYRAQEKAMAQRIMSKTTATNTPTATTTTNATTTTISASSPPTRPITTAIIASPIAPVATNTTTASTNTTTSASSPPIGATANTSHAVTSVTATATASVNDTSPSSISTSATAAPSVATIPASASRDRTQSSGGTQAEENTRRGWSLFLMLVTSIIVILVSIGVAYYLSSAGGSISRGGNSDSRDTKQ